VHVNTGNKTLRAYMRTMTFEIFLYRLVADTNSYRINLRMTADGV